MQILRTLVIALGLSVLTSGCLLVAAGAVEADRHGHKAPPPPSTPSAAPDAGAAPAAPSNGATNL